MFESVNRNALIIKPKQALLDWVNSIFPEDPLFENTLGKHDDANVYLIPEMDCTEDSLKYLKENFQPIFEELLFEWCEDDTLWPQKRNWQLFENWFDYSIQSVVIDLDRRELFKEEF